MFYISSIGHSGSGFLSNTLTSHPKIICWHGTMSIPPNRLLKNELSEEQFVNGLMDCERESHGQKFFGATHAYHGIKIKKIIEEKNGQFFSTVRNPIKRITSMYEGHITKVISYEVLPAGLNVDLYKLLKENENAINSKFSQILKHHQNVKKSAKFVHRPIKKILEKIHVLDLLKSRKLKRYYGVSLASIFDIRNILKNYYSKIKLQKKVSFKKMEMEEWFGKTQIEGDGKLEEVLKNLDKNDLSERLIKGFLFSCDRQFDSDEPLLANCNDENILKFEEYIVSSEYLDNHIIRKICGENASREFLDKIYKKPKIHPHSFKAKLSPEEIFNLWPKSYKNYFLNRLNNSSAMGLYKKLGYNLNF